MLWLPTGLGNHTSYSEIYLKNPKRVSISLVIFRESDANLSDDEPQSSGEHLNNLDFVRFVPW